VNAVSSNANPILFEIHPVPYDQWITRRGDLEFSFPTHDRFLAPISDEPRDLRFLTAISLPTPPEDERGIGAPEAEGVGHRILHRCREPLVLDQAKAASLIDILQICHGWSNLIPER
jgi:hypothetical protein